MPKGRTAPGKIYISFTELRKPQLNANCQSRDVLVGLTSFKSVRYTNDSNELTSLKSVRWTCQRKPLASLHTGKVPLQGKEWQYIANINIYANMLSGKVPSGS